MKSVKVKSVSSYKKRTNTRRSISAKDEFGSEVPIPTPKDFDNFLPWVCLQLQVPRVVAIKRINQEDYLPRVRRHSRTRSKLKTYFKKSPENDDKKGSASSSETNITISTDTQNAITITTYYNTKGHLVEIAFTNCPYDIHRKVVRAINLCLPFHPVLHKFAIKGGGLTQTVLYEIAKLLPYSNMTNICLDNNYVVDGNYHLILQKESQLQYLSLRQCEINDDECKKIANNLDYGTPASKSLLTLDLSSNRITDVGAQVLGRMLRGNRMLVHLNLANNKITDLGASHILDHLLLFPLNDDDIYDLKQRYIKYCLKKIEVYKQCEKEIINKLREEEEKKYRMRMKRSTDISKNEDKQNRTQIRRYSEFVKHRTSRKLTKVGNLFIELPSINEQVDKKAKEIVGEFKDIFDDRNVRYKRGQLFAIGNLKLCSLNLAYNDLGYFSVRKVYEILKYQRELPKPVHCKGLLRIILDGNNIPKVCDELEAIELFLETAVSESISISELNRSTSALKSLRRIHRK